MPSRRDSRGRDRSRKRSASRTRGRSGQRGGGRGSERGAQKDGVDHEKILKEIGRLIGADGQKGASSRGNAGGKATARTGEFTEWNGKRYFHGVNSRKGDWTCTRCWFPDNWGDKQRCFVCQAAKRLSLPRQGGQPTQQQQQRPQQQGQQQPPQRQQQQQPQRQQVQPAHAKTLSSTAADADAKEHNAHTSGRGDDDEDDFPPLSLTAQACLATARRPPQSAAVVAWSVTAAAADTSAAVTATGAAAVTGGTTPGVGCGPPSPAGPSSAGSLTPAAAGGNSDGASQGTNGVKDSEGSDAATPTYNQQQLQALKCLAPLPGHQWAAKALAAHAEAEERKRGAQVTHVAPCLDGLTPLQQRGKANEHVAKLERARADMTAKHEARRAERLEERQAQEAAFQKQIDACRARLLQAEEELAKYSAERNKDEGQWRMLDERAVKDHDIKIAAAQEVLMKVTAAAEAAGEAANVVAPAVTQGEEDIREEGDKDGTEDAGGDDDDVDMPGTQTNSIDAAVATVMPYVEPPKLAITAEDKGMLLAVYAVMTQWQQQGVEFPLTLTTLGLTATQLATFVGPQTWAEFYAGDAIPEAEAPLDRRLLGILSTAVTNALVNLQVDEAARQSARQSATATMNTAAEFLHKAAALKKPASKGGAKVVIRNKSAGK